MRNQTKLVSTTHIYVLLIDLVIDQQGNIQVYRKLHLFDVEINQGPILKESDATLKGQSIVPPISTSLGHIGLGTCYDLRFPEFSTLLRQQGMDIMTYPSAFTVKTGMTHWDILLKARAIENQCYVIAAAQQGKHGAKRESFGRAQVPGLI